MLEGNAGRTCGGSRDTELANDPEMRSETETPDFLDALLTRGIREITRDTQHENHFSAEKIQPAFGRVHCFMHCLVPHPGYVVGDSMRGANGCLLHGFCHLQR